MNCSKNTLSLGAVHLLLGALTKNLNRGLISNFLEMGVTTEYLVVEIDCDYDDADDMISRISSPFSWPLWVTTFVVLVFLSLLCVIQENSISELKETPIDKSV